MGSGTGTVRGRAGARRGSGARKGLRGARRLLRSAAGRGGRAGAAAAAAAAFVRPPALSPAPPQPGHRHRPRGNPGSAPAPRSHPARRARGAAGADAGRPAEKGHRGIEASGDARPALVTSPGPGGCRVRPLRAPNLL